LLPSSLSPLFELARVLVRFDHIASRIAFCPARPKEPTALVSPAAESSRFSLLLQTR
jgi:hypothetical protein